MLKEQVIRTEETAIGIDVLQYFRQKEFNKEMTFVKHEFSLIFEVILFHSFFEKVSNKSKSFVE